MRNRELALMFQSLVCSFFFLLTCSQREANGRSRQWNSHNQPSSVAALPGKTCSLLLMNFRFRVFRDSVKPKHVCPYFSFFPFSVRDSTCNSCLCALRPCPMVLSTPTMCLFALLITFKHPVSSSSTLFVTPWQHVWTQLGKMRLMIPCRALTCSHLQCFDATLYIQMNEKKPTWVCPVCDKKAPYEHLIIDGCVNVQTEF